MKLIKNNFFNYLLYSCIYIFNYSGNIQADVVKPALIEININTNESVTIEIRTSIEALLTGINSKYKNTKDSPNAKLYDDLRVLDSFSLRKEFTRFEEKFIHEINLSSENKDIDLKIDSIQIPLPGYTKVPRTSVITLQGKIERDLKKIYWLYPEIFGDNAVRVRQIDEVNDKWHWSEWQWLRNGEKSKEFSLDEVFTQESISSILKTYIESGFKHIIPKGFDHILFILGIFLVSSNLSILIWQVSMFTLAHTISLGLSMNGYINVTPSIVEPLIALSIAYIALENIIKFYQQRQSKTTNKTKLIRLTVIFIFGLLHGLGFATMLTEFGLPEHAFIISLISFNIGVEIGQLTIILLAYILLTILIDKIILQKGFYPYYKIKNINYYTVYISIPISIIIGLIGIYLTYERIDIGAINEVYR